jgi:tetratricopeptide (TPR) repeat protein
MKPLEKTLKAALRESPGDVGVRCNLARVWLERGRYADAERVIDDGLSLSATNADLLHFKADMLIGRGRLDDAEVAITAAVAAGVDEVIVAQLRGECSLQRGDAGAAVEHLLRVVEAMPDVQSVRMSLATAYIELPEPASAIPHLELVLAAEPTAADAHALMAEALYALERFDRSLHHAERALALDPGHEEAALTKAGDLEQSKGPGAAAEWLQDWLDEHSRSVRGHELLAELYERAGYLGSAIDVGRRLLKVAPDHAIGRINLASRLFRTGHYEEAARHARQALSLSEYQLDTRLLLANIAVQTRRLDEMELHIDAAERLGVDGSGACVLTARGQLALARDRTADAERLYRAALEEDNQHEAAWSGLALTLEAAGRLDEAIEAARTATGLAPTDKTLRYQLADLLDRTGRSAEADAELEAIKKMSD